MAPVSFIPNGPGIRPRPGSPPRRVRRRRRRSRLPRHHGRRDRRRRRLTRRGGEPGRGRIPGPLGMKETGAMASAASYPESPAPSFLFDLDGTLIDSVYQHVIAWRTALARIGIDLSVWRIHRRIGMSGGLFVSALLRETGRTLSAAEIERLQLAHAAQYREQLGSVT